eukprot:2294351-Pyramimonas_sp.AAC.1
MHDGVGESDSNRGEGMLSGDANLRHELDYGAAVGQCERLQPIRLSVIIVRPCQLLELVAHIVQLSVP